MNIPLQAPKVESLMRINTTVIRHCEHCGREFFPLAEILARSGRRFCSRSCSNRSRVAPLSTSFWLRVEKTGACWIWRGPVNDSGYGFLGSASTTERLTHRVSWTLCRGPIPAGMLVCHSCDVLYERSDKTYRRCVNPDHLFLGTPLDNARDRDQKGRARRDEQVARGEQTRGAKLTADIVRTIRSEYALGRVTQEALAHRFGVQESAIHKIVRRKNWRHVI